MVTPLDRETVFQNIRKELATAAAARKVGNEGKVRVCARRAAGIAISYWLENHPRNDWGVDAMSQLRHLQADDLIEQQVRDAACRLTTRVTETFELPFPADPVADAEMIISHLLPP